jgi:hypothetical protein
VYCLVDHLICVYRLDLIWPAPLESLAQCIAYLSHMGMSASTVATYISGLSHYHKLNDLQDNTDGLGLYWVVYLLLGKGP